MVAALCATAAALDNGRALSPVMGFNTWPAFHEHIDEDLIRQTADALANTGLVAAGYTTLALDGALPAAALASSKQDTK